MIIKGNNQVSPDVSIEIDGSSVDYKSIHSLVINIEENKHDVLTIHMNGIQPYAITDYIDAAVRVSVSLGPGRSYEFCGYVLYVEPESVSSGSAVNNSIFQKAKIVCFGASVSMKSTKIRVWENASTVSIAKTIADDHGFSLDVIKDSFVIPQIVQTKQSDWEFISDFCKKYGYSVTVHGTHMRLWDSNKALGRMQSFEILSAPSKVANLQPGSIIKFHGTFGYLTPEGVAYNYSVESIDNTGRMLKTTGKYDDSSLMWSGVGRPTRFNSSLLASSNSPHESEKIIEANFKKKLPFNATVDTISALGTIPGGVVLLTGYNSKFEGYWYVRSVEHEIIGSNCATKLRISKDFNLTNTAVMPSSEISKDPPPSRFVNKSWKAEIEKVEVYV